MSVFNVSFFFAYDLFGNMSELDNISTEAVLVPMVVLCFYEQKPWISCLNPALNGVLFVSVATHQAENIYCQLNNYSLKLTVASRHLNLWCKYPQKLVRKYPTSQGTGKEIVPKVISRLPPSLPPPASLTSAGWCRLERVAFQWTFHGECPFF